MNEEWREEALCVQTDPELFFPMKGCHNSVKPAKYICSHCPVSAECLQDALDHDEQFGIWGGLTPRERRLAIFEQDRTVTEFLKGRPA